MVSRIAKLAAFNSRFQWGKVTERRKMLATWSFAMSSGAFPAAKIGES
jgi:hypothetical protein